MRPRVVIHNYLRSARTFDQPQMSIGQEAELLSKRTGLRRLAVERWMRAKGIKSIMDLMHRYPQANHPEAMQLAANEIEHFILNEDASNMDAFTRTPQAGFNPKRRMRMS